MFSPRWSTFTLLSLSAVAISLGFCLGQKTRPHPLPATRLEKLNFNPSAAPAPAPAFPTMETTVPTGRPVAVAESPARRWFQLIARPPTPARDNELMAALSQLAVQNPLRAIALASAQTNRRFRAQLLDAVFQAWGQTDPNAAADWILSQPADSLDPDPAIAAVLKGAVQNPSDAIKLVQRLNGQNPGQAREYGDALIYALAQNGSFQYAADFAANSDGQLRTEWLAAAYGSWGNYQPQTAALSALVLPDAEARAGALDAVFDGWGQIDPQGLANFAVNDLPAGNQKTHALSDALVLWAGENPDATAAWINQFGPAPEFDSGAAAIATQTQVMKQPAIAINWAETITDPNLRSRTVAAVVETWALSDLSSALDFSQTSADLTPADRADLLSKLGQ